MLKHLSDIVFISGANVKIYVSNKNICHTFSTELLRESTLLICKRSYCRSTEKGPFEKRSIG